MPANTPSPSPPVPTVGAVVLAWQEEPWLAECLDAVLASTGVAVQVVLVDNGCTRDDLVTLGARPAVTVLSPGSNTGFAGGCNLGVAQLTASSTPPDYVALVNSDCLLAPDALSQLVVEAADPSVGPVMASVRLAEQPELINSAGNPVHVLGVSWAGGMDERETRTAPFDVAGASGAAMLLRHELWERLDGFDDAYFAYLEDTELSLRCARLGLRARCVPTAVAAHHYEFSRNPTKMYLLERNRLLLLATMWPIRALLLLLPLLVVLEVGITAQAIAQGWGRHKVRGWWWLWRDHQHVRGRRQLLQAESSTADWMGVLTAQLGPRVIGSAVATKAANALVGVYWSGVRRLL